MKILVTGATGYVGGRLVPLLLERGHEVRTTTTDPDREQPWWGDRVESVVMDALDPHQVAAACEGVDAVYYLIHGMGGDDFVETDRKAAINLADGVRAHGVDRIVYLSGVVPDVAEDELSEHITSRLEVEQILSDAPATVVVLRAAVLLGSGSTSFEIIRQVSERMPVHTVPTWMDSTVQPIAVVDVLEALVGALEYGGPSRHFDVGGPDALSYGALIDAYTSHAGLERPQVEVPLLPTALVGTLVGSLTDVPRPVVEALVQSLRHDMVASDDDFKQALLPEGHRLVGLDEAFRRALAPRSHGAGRRRPGGSAAAGPGVGQRRRRQTRTRQGSRRGQGRPAGLLRSWRSVGESNPEGPYDSLPGPMEVSTGSSCADDLFPSTANQAVPSPIRPMPIAPPGAKMWSTCTSHAPGRSATPGRATTPRRCS